MIPSFAHESPAQRLVFGPGRIAEVPAELERMGRSRPLVLCSWRRERYSKDLASLVRSLPDARLYAGVEAHVPREIVEAARKDAREHEADVVVTFGGGSATDLGKALAYLAAHGDEALAEGRIAAPQASPPLAHLAIPTTYSGSEASVRFGVTDRAREEKRGAGGPGVLPGCVVADPTLTLGLGAKETASTGMNALAHCAEALYSTTRSAITDAIAAHAAGLLVRWLPVATERGDHLEARNELLAASYLAGSVLNQAGMGVHHGICHGLGGRLGVPHGLANAVVLPHAMRFNLDVAREGQEALARAIGAVSAEQAIERIEGLASSAGLPRRLREVGVMEEDLEPLAEWAAERSPAVRGNPKPVAAPDVLGILRAAW